MHEQEREHQQEERTLLTVAETARELGLSVEGIQKRLRTGVMRGERVSPRLWLVPRDEVERWRARGRLRPGPVPRRAPNGPDGHP